MTRRKRKRKRACFCGDRYESPLPARSGAPTPELPGSPGKIAVLRERAARRESLFVAGDLVDAELIRLNLVQRGNGAYVLDESSPVLDSRGDGQRRSGEGLRKLQGATPGDRIRQARQRAGHATAKYASLSLGLSPATLGAIERREASPSLWVIYLASRAFDADPDWLAALPGRAG